MSWENQQPILIEDHRGLFARGEDEGVPPNYARDVLNNAYKYRTVQTREGSSLDITKSGIKRAHLYKKASGNRLLILVGDDLFDASVSLSVPIKTVSGAIDFSAVTMFDRCYIMFHNRVTGHASVPVQVYDGTTCRDAGGSAPTGFTLGAATSVTAGNVDAGKYLFALAYETASGFITAPGPATFTLYTAPGGKKIDLSSIPTAPAGVSFIHILATKTIVQYSGRASDYELFFIPGERFAPGSSTRTINFYSNDLVSSADYLLDMRSSIPAGVQGVNYKGRLVIVGLNSDPALPIISRAGNPEQMSTVDGYVVVNPGDAGGGVKNATVSESGNLYFHKSKRTYFTSATEGGEPVEWPTPLPLDSALGTECFGASVVLDSDGTTVGISLLATRLGLMVFDGSFTKKELTWSIDKIWKRINQAYFNTIQIYLDSDRQRIYINVPLDAATSPSHLLVADYTEGLTVEGIKWDIWTFPIVPTSILVDIDQTTQKPVFKFASTNVYKLDESVKKDFGNNIDSYYETGLVTLEDGQVCSFQGARLNLRGVGNLTITLAYKTNTPSVTLSPIVLALLTDGDPGKEIIKQFNFNREAMRMKFRVNGDSHYYVIKKVVIYGHPLWTDNPFVASGE